MDDERLVFNIFYHLIKPNLAHLTLCFMLYLSTEKEQLWGLRVFVLLVIATSDSVISTKKQLRNLQLTYVSIMYVLIPLNCDT